MFIVAYAAALLVPDLGTLHRKMGSLKVLADESVTYSVPT